MIHDNSTSLIIDLRIDSRVSDEIDDPLLSFVLIEA
jgi:hypothetical protein